MQTLRAQGAVTLLQHTENWTAELSIDLGVDGFAERHLTPYPSSYADLAEQSYVWIYANPIQTVPA